MIDRTMENPTVDAVQEESAERATIEKPKTKRVYVMTEARKQSLERMKEGRRRMMEKKQAEKEALARQQAEEAGDAESEPEPESNSSPDAEPEAEEPKPVAKPKRVYKKRKAVIKTPIDRPPSPIATPTPRPYFVV
jgi:hypothetical protein